MASDLLSIAKSGTRAARVALDITAQNIANASTEGYVRRSVALEEVTSTGGIGRQGEVSVSGVRLDRVIRNADLFRQSEVRRTGSDSARANAEVAGLENIEAAIEGADIYPAIVRFEGTLQQLSADPTNNSLRASVVEEARTLARSFNIGSQALDSARDGMHFEADASVEQVNQLAQELGRVNLRLARASDASSDQTALLDQRDSLLKKLSEHTDVTTTFAVDDTVEVRIGGATGPVLVSGGSASTLAMTKAANGTLSFTLGGAAVSPTGGALAGKALALTKLADTRSRIDAVANSVIVTVNAAQAAGIGLDGSAGQPMFSGTGAGSMTLTLSNGAGIATAPAGAGANSRDGGNLEALRNALAAADPAGMADAAIFDISSTVAGRSISRDALQTIADNANVALQAQAGVDLDQEAVNLIRFQQAFQASGRVMQIASNLFDTLIGIK
ncbi:MAG TPA: flagellar hook-associated protein FlgK [Novosphingobium sp.]